MRKYSHDYTLVQHADNLLQEALVKIRWDNWWDARIRIEDARKKLQQYLSQDNMVPDDDTADGWVKAADIPERTFTVKDPASKPSAQKVEKHGQIDSQYLKQDTSGADPTNPLYLKTVVESGTYEQIGMTRDEVAAAIQKLGAKLNRDVSKAMNIFVTGNKPGPSKMQKVQQWREEGLDIRIISQIEFKEIFDKYIGDG